ncbi:hypothetical protein EYR41_011879 [Orbilia oligospora]|uniref:Uncharacterized protein n=1 Tax=Orbilia oligospora TaxID=2813651 RepID=A0A7C8PRG7_ORBOL|nr:hypothetical protein TWF751_003173 [Orbilia oligospora]TGJ62691.1 hypothetical protein EYR41_011879 [Orbilia oligospora]
MSDFSNETEKRSAINGYNNLRRHKNTAFHLHHSVVRSSSEFFKTACKTDTFKEGITRVIHLPEIDVATFERVIAWQYEQGYDIP